MFITNIVVFVAKEYTVYPIANNEDFSYHTGKDTNRNEEKTRLSKMQMAKFFNACIKYVYFPDFYLGSHVFIKKYELVLALH